MSGYLLDTNAVLFALARPERLSAAALDAIQKGPNRISVVSYWEVVLKAARGKLDVGEPRLWWQDALKELGAVPLPLRTEHVDRLNALESIHNDPFDRILVTQAIVEGFGFVTADQEMRGYSGSGLRVVW